MWEPDDYPFFQSIHFAKKPFLYPSSSSQSSWWKISNAAMNLIISVPQTAATTFAFSSVYILLLCRALHSKYPKPIFSNPPPTVSLFCTLWSRFLGLQLAQNQPTHRLPGNHAVAFSETFNDFFPHSLPVLWHITMNCSSLTLTTTGVGGPIYKPQNL